MPGQNERGSAPGGRGGRGRGRDDKGGKRGDKRGGGRGGKDDRGGGYRVVNELGGLEKALTKTDYEGQKYSLEQVLKALRPLRVKSIESLDPNTKGKLLTSLLRVGRQPKPPEEATPESAAPVGESAPPQEPAGDSAAPATESAPSQEAAGEPAAAATETAEAPPAEAAPHPDPLPSEGEGGAAATDDAAASSLPEAAQPEPATTAPPPPSKVSQWQDVMELLGRIWRSVGDQEKATRFFEASGRSAPSAEAEVPEASSDAAPRPVGERGPRRDRPERPPPPEKLMPGDWRLKARDIEEKGRTRDAAKIHEQHESWAEAARLYEVGGDFKSGLRCAYRAKDEARIQKLASHVKPEEVPQLLEQAGAWELLMEHHVKAGNFEAVARLYERSKQFDQAALAYERSGKLTLARKAYERAKDLPAVNRLRDLEVKKLIERGDRLGAATLLIAAQMKTEAIEALKGLPGPKVFRFMQKLKLDAEALEYAKTEMAKAVEEKQPATHARWLEMLGDTAAAVEAWLLAERKDKALPLLEQLGNWQKAAELAENLGQLDKAQELFHRANDHENADRVAKLPRPATPPPEPPKPEADEASA